ncbi:hypothetical protein C8039_18895 [Halogeometricum sp. wsp3]|nr:hypothetical protein C8039_18895 [Halogeometricum sp. wsp3]
MSLRRHLQVAFAVCALIGAVVVVLPEWLLPSFVVALELDRQSRRVYANPRPREDPVVDIEYLERFPPDGATLVGHRLVRRCHGHSLTALDVHASEVLQQVRSVDSAAPVERSIRRSWSRTAVGKIY